MSEQQKKRRRKRHPQREELQQESISVEQFMDEVFPGLREQADLLPPTWGYVNGRPFTGPLPDGKPVVIPESCKLPPEMRGRRAHNESEQV